MDWVCTWKTGKWKIDQCTGFDWLTSINLLGKCEEEKIAKHRQMIKICHSHLTHIFLNYCMRRFFFGLVYRKSCTKAVGKCSKILNIFLFLFSNKMLVFMAGNHKMLDRIGKQGRPWSDCAVWQCLFAKTLAGNYCPARQEWEWLHACLQSDQGLIIDRSLVY